MWCPRLAVVLLAMAVLAAPGAAVAQSLCTGCRVRVTAPVLLPGRVEGRVGHLGPDTLFLQTDRLLPLPVSRITDIELYRGTRGHAGTGALVGAGSFGAAALAIGFSLKASETCLFDMGFGSGQCEYTTGQVLALGGISAAVGAGLGAVVGSLIRSDKWEDVLLHTIRIEPGVDAVAVSLALPVRDMR